MLPNMSCVSLATPSSEVKGDTSTLGGTSDKSMQVKAMHDNATGGDGTSDAIAMCSESVACIVVCIVVCIASLCKA